MVGYKLSKNDWVTPFFVIFRSVREKLLVTVFFDHPVEMIPGQYYPRGTNILMCSIVGNNWERVLHLTEEQV